MWSAYFGGDDDLFTPGRILRDPVSNVPLGVAGLVARVSEWDRICFGGVDKIDSALFYGVVELFEGVLLGILDAPCHGTETNLGDLERR